MSKQKKGTHKKRRAVRENYFDNIMCKNFLTGIGMCVLFNSRCEVVHSAQTRGEAIVVGYHHRGVQRLEIQNQNWIRIEFRFRFQNQRKTLWCGHSISMATKKLMLLRDVIQWNLSIKDLRNKDTSLIRTLHVVPRVSQGCP